MKRNIIKKIELLTILFFLLATTVNSQKKILFDTDFGGDADDLGALSMLHGYVNSNDIELLGIMVWSTEASVVPAIDAVNRYYGNPDIPIGVQKGPYHDDPSNYNKPIADALPFELENEDVTEVTKLYREILSQQPDSSVTLVTVGPLLNIQMLLQSGPDDYSSLSGKELIHKKVKEMVVMGGKYPSGENEWNFSGNMKGVTKYVFEHVELPVVFSGYEIGVSIKTASVFNDIDPSSPLYIGFKYFSEHAPWMKEYYKGEILDNSTYDQTAVLYAVERGLGQYWEKVKGGHNEIDENGNNSWVNGAETNQSYLKLIEDPENMAGLIEYLMLKPEPKTYNRSLQVSSNHKYIRKPDGKPFLWLGDTAWELFHKLDKKEVKIYLEVMI